MYPEKPLITKVIMSALTFILILACELGNGLMFAVIARFKSLRTIQNILIANLCLVDFLSAVIAFTMYMIYTVLEAGWFRGKALGILTCGFDRLFATLNLLSMLVILVNKYLAISYGFKYLTWKTKTNAVICISLVWFVSIISTVSSLILLSDINLGDAHVIHYRTEIFKQGKLFVAATRAFFCLLCSSTVVLDSSCDTGGEKKGTKLCLFCFVNCHSLSFMYFWNHLTDDGRGYICIILLLTKRNRIGQIVALDNYARLSHNKTKNQ